MTPLQVSCWRGKFLWWIQSGTPSTIIWVHDRAVGVTNLGVMLLCITGPLVMIFPPENKYHRITLVNDWFISLQVIGWCHQATEYFITWAFLYWKFAFRIQTQTMYEHPKGMSTGFCNKNWTSGWMVSYIWIDAHTHPTCASVQGSLPKILQSLKGMGHGITTKFGRHLSNTAANFKAIWTF